MSDGHEMTTTVAQDQATQRVVAAIQRSNRALVKKYAYHPHEKQERFHRSTARVRGLFTGNRFGKTDATVREAIMWATGRNKYRTTPKPPVSIRYYVDGYEGPHLKEVVLPKFKEYCNPTEWGGGFDQIYKRGDRELTHPNGSRIRFLSYNMTDSQRSTQAYGGSATHLHIFDEHLFRFFAYLNIH